MTRISSRKCMYVCNSRLGFKVSISTAPDFDVDLCALNLTNLVFSIIFSCKTFQHSCNFDFTAWKSHPDHWHSVLWDFTEMWSKLHREQISTSVSDFHVEGHCWWWQLIAGSQISFLLKSALFPSMKAALQVGNKTRSMLSIFFFTISGPRICPPPKFCFINRRWRTICGCYWTVACAARRVT